MRVLWLCNIMLPVIGESLGLPYSMGGGWLSGLSHDVRCHADEITLAVCFPMDVHGVLKSGMVKGNESLGELQYYGFPSAHKLDGVYDLELENYMQEILDDYKPDLIHIFGTEYTHTYAMLKVADGKYKSVVSMQGVISVCAERYEAKLPKRIVNRYTFRDFVKKDNIAQAKSIFEKRSEYEIKALSLAKNVIGRTSFDKNEVLGINPKLKYFKLNETLRDLFYKEQWDLGETTPYSVMFSQANYPLKGFHFVLEAFAKLLKQYPEARLFVAGDKIISDGSLKSRIRESSYGKYLGELIHKNHLEEKIEFLGPLKVKEMCALYQKCHVFVSASVIENSPNSVGEAMLLGMPVISSNVGGVPDLMENGKEGILFENGDVGGLYKAMVELFENPEKAVEIGRRGRERASITHQRDHNYEQLMNIYREIEAN